ncbi:MAG TPA: hypothetical protein VJ773_11790 [Gemmatimonadales bacterium]|nr:hypothetical protein [Gemmatimonadales bacterium]
MDRYWLKIGLGALAVFGIGLGVWSVVRQGVDEVRSLAESDRAISIPLFGIVPFNVGGERAGRINRITFLRDAPKEIAGVVIRVGHADSLPADAFAGCSFTVKDPTNIDEKTQFLCLTDSTQLAGLEGFGEVRIETAHGVVVRKILLPPAVIADYRDPAKFDARVEGGSPDAEEAARLGDSIGAAMGAMGDSIAAAAAAKAESAAAEATRRAGEAKARVGP